MATYETIANTLTTLLNTTLAAESVSLVLENSRTAGTVRSQSDEWADVTIDNPPGALTEIGSTRSLPFGRMTVGIYTPLGNGVKRSREIASALTTAFQGVRTGDASCLETDYRNIGRDPHGQHWHAEWSVRFRWEHDPT